MVTEAVRKMMYIHRDIRPERNEYKMSLTSVLVSNAFVQALHFRLQVLHAVLAVSEFLLRFRPFLCRLESSTELGLQRFRLCLCLHSHLLQSLVFIRHRFDHALSQVFACTSAQVSALPFATAVCIPSSEISRTQTSINALWHIVPLCGVSEPLPAARLVSHRILW